MSIGATTTKGTPWCVGSALLSERIRCSCSSNFRCYHLTALLISATCQAFTVCAGLKCICQLSIAFLPCLVDNFTKQINCNAQLVAPHCMKPGCDRLLL